MPVDFLPVDEGGLRGGVTDLQGRYNLNNLAVTDPPAYEQQLTVFIRLFQLTTEGDEYQARGIANAIRDYLDSNSAPTGSGGAEAADRSEGRRVGKGCVRTCRSRGAPEH